MSTELASKLSPPIEFTQWLGSILAATAYRSIWNTTSVACLLGAVVSYKIICALFEAKKTAANISPEVELVDSKEIIYSAETSKTTKTSEDADVDTYNDPFPVIDLTSTDITESDESDTNDFDADDTEEEENEDWNEETYKLQFSSQDTNDVPSHGDSQSIGMSYDKEDDKDDWNEDHYNERFPAPEKVVAPEKVTTRAVAKKKESLSQMRKRVAREMKESKERRMQHSSVKTVSAKPVRKKETIAEMKARVAREFAAKLKK